MFWTDTRIKVELPEGYYQDYVLANREIQESIWVPDIFIPKAKMLRKPSVAVNTHFLRFHNDSSILLSKLVNFDLSCSMYFADYPLDTQLCLLTFESYSYTTNLMNLTLDLDASRFPQKGINELQLNQHTVYVDFFSMQNNGYSSSGVYPGLTLRFFLHRKLTYHLLRTYLPSSLFVFLAWFSMFIPNTQVPGRVAMAMTTLLTLAAMFGSLSTVTPPISYTTKLDLWMVSCIVFVFGILLEFTIIMLIKGNVFSPPEKKVEQGDTTPITSPWVKEVKEQTKKTDILVMRIERCSIVAFLVLFAVFNIVYWADVIATIAENQS